MLFAGALRDRLAWGRLALERSLMPLVARGRRQERARILCYHSVGTPQWGVHDVGPERFRRQLELALERGYRFVPAGRIARGGGEPGELAVTFDDGLASVGHHAGPILAELGIPWTVFVVGNWTEGRHGWEAGTFMTWTDLARAAESGAEIGSHSISHPDFGRLGVEAARRELAGSRSLIEDRIGSPPSAFAVPFGRPRNWRPELSEVAREAGYELVYMLGRDSGQGPGTRTLITGLDSNRIFLAALAGAFG